jgi:hypothetical protein
MLASIFCCILCILFQLSSYLPWFLSTGLFATSFQFSILFTCNFTVGTKPRLRRNTHVFLLFSYNLVPKVSFAVDKKMFPNLLTQLSISGCVIFSLSKLSKCASRSCIVFIFKLFKKSILSESFHFRGFSELFTVHVFSSSCTRVHMVQLVV